MRYFILDTLTIFQTDKSVVPFCTTDRYRSAARCLGTTALNDQPTRHPKASALSQASTAEDCLILLEILYMESRNQQQQQQKQKKPFPFLMNFNLITPAHQISNPKEMLSLILMSVSIQFSLLLNSVFTRVKYISSPVSSQQEKLVMRLNLQTAGWESRLKIDSLFNPKCLQKVIFQLCSCWSDWLVFITAAPAHKWNLLKGAPSPLIN